MNNCYVIVFFCISTSISRTTAVTFTGPDSVVSKKGSNVTMTCIFDEDCSSVAWNCKDKPIYSKEKGFLGSLKQRSSIVNSTAPGSCISRVTISDLKLDDSGTYSCSGIASAETAFVKKAELVVVDFTDDNCNLPANNTSVVENETVTITCKISTSYNGSTPLELVLQRNDGHIMNSSTTLKSIKASVIAVPPVVPAYKCLLKVDFRNAPEDFARNTPQETKICGSADRVMVMSAK